VGRSLVAKTSKTSFLVQGKKLYSQLKDKFRQINQKESPKSFPATKGGFIDRGLAIAE